MECKKLIFDDLRMVLTGKTELFEPNISHTYSDIYQYQLFTENHNEAGSSMGFGIGRAIIGGAISGPVGGILAGLTKRNTYVTSYTTCTVAISFKQGEAISVSTTYDLAMDYMKALDQAYQLANDDDDDDNDDDNDNIIPQIAEMFKNSVAKEEPIVINPSANADSLIKRAFTFLENNEWKKADTYSDYALDLEPENAKAYLVKLMIERNINHMEELSSQTTPLENSVNYKKVLQYADSELSFTLQNYNQEIKCSPTYIKATGILAVAKSTMEVEKAQQLFQSISGYEDVSKKLEQCQKKLDSLNERDYTAALKLMNSASTITQFTVASEKFKQLSNYKDSFERYQKCLLKMNECEKENEYQRAIHYKSLDTMSDLRLARDILTKLDNWKDTDTLLSEITIRLEELETETQQQLVEEKKKRRLKRIILSIVVIGIICVGLILISKGIKYLHSDEYLQQEVEKCFANDGGYYDALNICEKMENDNLKEEVYNQIVKAAVSDMGFSYALDVCNQIKDDAIQQKNLVLLTKEAISVHDFDVALTACNQIKDDAIQQKNLVLLTKKAISADNFDVALTACNCLL